jgi:hypothetical protein
MRMLGRIGALLLSLGMLAPATGLAVTIPLSAVIDCAQANAGAGTCGLGGSGTGSMTGSIDTVSHQLSWNISWSGLSGTETVMHFHGPALPNANAGVQVNFGAISGTTSPSVGSTAITALQEADLLAGLWYVNIHTDLFPGGEIRGQVVPEPGGLLLLAASLGALAALRRRAA